MQGAPRPPRMVPSASWAAQRPLPQSARSPGLERIADRLLGPIDPGLKNSRSWTLNAQAAANFGFRAAKLASLCAVRYRGGMFLLAATLSWAACAGALVLPLRHPAAALAGTRGCCRMAAEVPTDQAKAGLVAALAELRRVPSPSAKRAVLSATSQLEARDDALSASADGRWALLFSTQGAPEVGPLTPTLTLTPTPNPYPYP